MDTDAFVSELLDTPLYMWQSETVTVRQAAWVIGWLHTYEPGILARALDARAAHGRRQASE